jgi:hypothetical protein
MTLDEKWTALKKHCENRSCENCALHGIVCDFGYSPPTEYAKRISEFYATVFCEASDATDTVGTDRPVIVESPALAKISKHADICTELNKLYARKNADYGDSFHKTFVEEGIAMARIRLSDKLERFKRLTRSNEQHVQDESVRDTLIDLANYAIMTVMELDGEKE